MTKPRADSIGNQPAEKWSREGNCEPISRAAWNDAEAKGRVAREGRWPPSCTGRSRRLLMSILAWIIFGLIVGVIAKFLMPGRDPGGFIVTILLGIAGALIGGFIGRSVGWYGANQGAGWIVSILGAIVLLIIYRLLVRRQA
jgi:uncharacterized membrane protein YeaQ/YmgE (transglycosylase-associated protein family)